MNKRNFLKVVSALPFLPGWLMAMSKHDPRVYLKECPWDELIGLRFEWPQPPTEPNPCPGFDWKISEQMRDHFSFKSDYYVHNEVMNKFMAVPIGKNSPQRLLAFGPVILAERDIDGNHFVDYRLADLSVGKFYRP